MWLSGPGHVWPGGERLGWVNAAQGRAGVVGVGVVEMRWKQGV